MSSREARYLQIISGQTRGPLAAIYRAALGAAEVPYAALMRLRNRLYDRGIWRVHDLGRPTISVGNLTAGGTGKTPVVRWLATRLQQGGHRPAVLLRGYRKANAAISDEQQMLETALPGVVVHADANRVSGARHVLASDPSTTHFILDDAFQHRRARRHFDLVLINACEPFGFGHVHPRGLLREAPHGLARANAVLVTHASEIPPQQQHTLHSELRRYCNCPIFQCDHVNDELLSADGLHRLPIGQLNDIRFVLFTGVGHPDAIVAQTRTLRGFRGERLYPDHHDYTRTDLDDLLRQSREAGATALLTTEKDYVKLKPLWHEGMPPLYRLCLHIRFVGDHEQALLQQIRRAISA